jgi:hypothetical protein
VDWLIDQPVSAAPLERVPEQARTAAIEAMRGQPREAVQEAAYQAVRDAIFGVELVLKVNVAAEETIRIEGLRHAAIFWEMRALSAEAELVRRSRSRDDRSGSNLAERWQGWCRATDSPAEGILLSALHQGGLLTFAIGPRLRSGRPPCPPTPRREGGQRPGAASTFRSGVSPSCTRWINEAASRRSELAWSERYRRRRCPRRDDCPGMATGEPDTMNPSLR